MKQLKLPPERLGEIGFAKFVHPKDKMNPERITYQISCMNGIFYCNMNEDIYRWYHMIKIMPWGYNHTLLDISSEAGLFTVLNAFKANIHKGCISVR